VVLPIPDVPPVTSATLPENALLFMESAFHLLCLRNFTVTKRYSH
jgi:hypothetical protein